MTPYRTPSPPAPTPPKQPAFWTPGRVGIVISIALSIPCAVLFHRAGIRPMGQMSFAARATAYALSALWMVIAWRWC